MKSLIVLICILGATLNLFAEVDSTIASLRKELSTVENEMTADGSAYYTAMELEAAPNGRELLAGATFYSKPEMAIKRIEELKEEIKDDLQNIAEEGGGNSVEMDLSRIAKNRLELARIYRGLIAYEIERKLFKQ